MEGRQITGPRIPLRAAEIPRSATQLICEKPPTPTDQLDVSGRIDQVRDCTNARAQHMSSAVHIEIEMPDDLARFRLPEGVQERLNTLLDKQDGGQPLTDSERREAEGLVDLADLLSLLRLRAERLSGHAG